MGIFTSLKSIVFISVFILILIGNCDVKAQITPLESWTNVYHGIATSAQTITYAVPTGSNSNRVLVVAIASSTTTASSRAVTLTYGGQTPTASVGDMATSTVQQHTQLYYFNEAKLDAATNTTLSVAVSGGTTRVTDVFAAVFDGIDQNTPITDSKTYSSGTNNTANPVFASALSVNANDLAIEIISSVRLNNATPRTITYATNWTMAAQQTWTTIDGVRNAVANRSIPATNTTDVSSVNLNAGARVSMTAYSLKAYIPTTPPNCSTPISPTNSATGVAVNSALIWNSTLGATGYRIYFGTDASATNILNGIDLGNVTSYTHPSNLSYLTNYYWKIVPYNSIGLATGCTTWSFTTEDINYCAPTYSNGTSYGDYISLVQLGNINNATGASTVSPYYTYYNTLSADLTAGGSYVITLGVGHYTSGNNIAAWIDFNKDGDFTDSGEKLGELNSLSGNATGTINFTVPLTAVLGTTRLRVREVWNISNFDVCSSYSYGETEDYNVTILASCNTADIPTLSASPSTICAGNSTTLSVTSGNLNDADHWQWYSGSCGGTPVGQGTSISVSPGTSTTYYARGEGSSCDGTSCGSVTITVNPGVPDYDATITDAACPSSADGSIETTLPIPIQFNSPDYIDINSTLLSNRGQFTLEGWIKVNLADVGSRISLFGQNDAIEFGFTSSSILNCWSASGGSVSTGSYPSDNAWHHVAAVGNGTNIILYIDGVSVASGGSSTANYGNNTSYPSKIGAGVWDPTRGNFPGSMLKVGFWGVALNATEIGNLASGHYNYVGSETGLLAGFNFYEGSGNTLNSEITGTNGTFNGTPTWTDPYSYSWTKTGDGSFSASSKNLTGIYSGEYNLTVTFGSCTMAKSFTVNSTGTSPGIPVLSSNSPICSGEDAVFTITGTVGDEVIYKLNGGSNIAALLADGSATIVVIAAETNQELTLVSVSNSYCTNPLNDSATIIVNPLPLTSDIETN